MLQSFSFTRLLGFRRFPVLLINLLLIAVVIVALFVQLITPLILNIPVMAIILIALVVAIWHFRRARTKSRVPVFATLTLVIQSLLFGLSIFILVVVTIPHESAHDTPAIVLGLRKFLASKGLIDPPREPEKAGTAAAQPMTVNAPDLSKVQIKIEDDEKTPSAAKTESGTNAGELKKEDKKESLNTP